MTIPLSLRFLGALLVCFLALAPPVAAQPSFPPTEAGARALLSQFLPGSTADKAAAMRRLRPTGADYRAVYNETLAGRLAEAHRQLWDSGAMIGGRADQTELMVVFVQTDDLIDLQPAAGDFPGGYRRILGEMRRGVPIVRFKFVKPGSSLGMAYDGLLYVNGHWVFVPKPWSVVEQ